MKKIFLFLTLLTLSVGQMWGDSFALVTNVNQLSSGDEIIIANTGGTKAMSTTQNSNNRGAVDVSVSSNKITSVTGLQVLILGTATKSNTTYWTLQAGSGNYLYAASSSNNYLRTKTTLADECKWSISLNNSNEATITSQGTYTRNIIKNNGTLFSCYSSGQTAVKIYKKVTLSSIAVKTAPTKVSYMEGENFAPAGLVIRLTYSDNSTEDVTYNNTTASSFTFSPSTSTALQTSNTSVSITYGGKSTSQAITVAASACTKKVTLATGNPSNGTISFSPTGPVETCDGNVNVTMTITPNAGYYLSTYSKTGVNTSNTPSITTGTSATAAQTPTLTFAQNANGTYTAGATFTAFVDHFIDEVQNSTGYTGEGMAKSGNYSNSLPTIADKTVATTGNCQALHYHFVGWVLSEYKDNPTGHIATLNGHATGATYYAVWAKKGTEETNTISADLNTLKAAVSSISSGYASKTFEMSDGVNSYTFTADVTKSTQSATNGWMQVGRNSDSRKITITDELPGNIINISSTSIYNGSASSYTGTVYYNTTASITEPIASKSLSSASDFSMDVTNGGTAGYIILSNPMCLGQLSVTYGTISYTDYITVCCNELGSINGSVSMTQTTAALEWADLDNVSSWAVQYKEHSAENWNTWNGAQATADSKRSVTITSLSCGTAYDFKIAATAAAGYCDAEQVLENQSTTKWNISYSLSGTVSLNEGPAQGANACGEISASFTKNALYTFPDEITVTIGGDEATVDDDYLWDADEGTLYIDAAHVTGNVAVTITGVAPANPSVTPDPTALSFTQVKKGADVPAAKDIALEGHNLTAALTVESSNTSLYVVSVKSGSLTPDGNKDASPVITVTPQAGITSTAGDKNATITISGGGLAADVEVNVTFNVQETYTVNWYVNGTKIDANSITDIEGTEVTAPSDFSAFTDCSELHFVGWATSAIAVAGTTTEPELVTPITAIGTTATTNYYAVFADGTPASVDTLLYEEFDNTTTSDASSEFATSKFPNFNGSLSKAYTSQYGGVKFGTGSVAGYITSKSLDLSEAFTVSLKARYYNTGGDNASIQVTVGSQTKTISYEDLTNDFKSFSLDFDAATSTSTVKIGTDVKRAYIDNVLVSQVVAEDFSMYYTTCPHVSRVTLSAAEVSNGSISFAVNSEAVTNVRTDEGDAVVDVVANPDPGYELTGLTLTSEDVTGATKNQDLTQITIPEDEEGTLTVTATFSQANYTVTMAQTGDADAELSEDQSNKHYNDVITVTAEDKAGYVFKGWTASPAVTFANAKALETTFSMPNGNVTVTAAYAKVYTPAEALALDDLTDSVYVEGVISQVDEVSTQYKNATYWISADGTTTNQIKIYRGKHINKADVTVDNAAQIAVGNKVRVRGKLSQSSNVNQFGQGASYITVLVEKTLSALTIVGDASVTTYDVGDSFDKTGLSLSATYNTGYVQTNYTGTTITSNYDAPTTFTAGVTSVTVSAEEGLISTSRDIAVTVSSAVLDYVVISADAQTEFWAKEQYKEPLLDAYLTDEPATVLHNVTGTSDVTGLDMSEPEDKSVTVTYTRKAGQTDDVTYNFTVKPVVVDEAHAHSVATAREIIDVDKTDGEDLDLASEDTKTHVIGVVTSVSALTGANAGKYTIVIKDQTDAAKVMTLYQVTLKSGITSVAQDDIIKAYGNLYYHSQSSKYEINTGGEVVAVVRTPNLTVADVAEMEVNITADLAEADLTIDKDGSNGDITFSCSDPAVTIVNNKLHAAEAGDATVTATIAADGIYTAAETTFNVHVIAERTRYAITMDANGGSGVDPVYENQLAGATVDLPADNTYTKANSAFDAWVVTETVSGDAVAVTNGHFTMPAANVTIKATWNEVETCAISFLVSGAEVATADAPQTAAYSLAEVYHPTIEGFTWVGWSETEYDDETTTLPTTISSYTPAVNEDSKTLYGIYSQEVGSASNKHYVLDYVTDVADKSIGYNTEVEVTATDGSEWVVSASKQTGMQINTGKVAYIKVPNCPANIVQIVLTCNSGAQKAVAFAETSDGDALVTSPADGTSQTLDLSGESVSAGYIIPYSGNCQITHIDVEYSGNVTYYTSSPVTRYNVTYAKGDATNVTGVCEAQRKAAGSITLCDAPTCADKNFAKWSDGVNQYNAGAEYTLSADVTFTATWTPKPKYTVTYTANGGVGTAPAVEEYMEGETVEVKENEYFSKPGFDYDGWLIVYNDGVRDQEITPENGEFKMVAYNVTIKAKWAEESKQKWALVTNVSDLVAGDKYIIAASGYNVAMAGQNENNRAETAVVKRNEGAQLKGTSSMQVITLAGTTGAWEFNTGAGYLYAASSSKNYLRTQETNDANGKWTITISDGVATITATGTNTNNKLKYNSGSKIFSCYSSGQQEVALYKEIPITVINDNDKDQDDVPDGGDMTIKEDKTWTVSSDKEVGDLYMEDGAVIANSAKVEANDLYFKARHGKSNQIFDLSKITVVSNMYYDFQLCDGDVDADYWYSISVPFDVNLNDGVFQVGGTTPLTNRSDFEVWEYNTAYRAQTQSNGWQRVKDNMMHAGKAYLIGFNPGQPNIIRLKAATGWKSHIFTGSSLSVAESTGSGRHDNWNGLANPTGRYIAVDKDAQVFNNNTHGWDSYALDADRYNFVVGTAFFVQSASAVAISNTDHGRYRAPQRAEAESSKCAFAVRITRDEATSFDNQIIVRASEDATREYEQGHDMLTMNNATSKTAAMLWTKNYGGMRLAIEEAPFNGDKASYELGMYAPAAGEYAISIAAPKENADLYLTKDGMIIWNLSMNECTLALNKGNNDGYGLLLVKKSPAVATGVENTEVLNGAQKVVIDNKVFILRGGKMYGVDGKEVK